MKVIGLMPVKNEAWILSYSLRALSQICDIVLVADQHSTDESRQIAKQFENVVLLDNDAVGHSNTVRWLLLDTARGYDGVNLIVSVDADEILPPPLFRNFLTSRQHLLTPGVWLTFWWVQLWKSVHAYRDDDSVWANNWKPVAFIDNRRLEYERTVVINDHTSRVPGSADSRQLRVEGVPLLHLQWAAWERAQTKQAWYRCVELLNSGDPIAINQKYAITHDDSEARCRPTPEEWWTDTQIPATLAQTPPGWHLQEILGLFDRYGAERFEPLDIWHLGSLRNAFHRQVGREPRVPANLLWKTKLRVKNLFQRGRQ
jgi:Glycosyl transferase family 2